MSNKELIDPVDRFLGAHETVSETIRSCYADFLMGNDDYSEFSRFSVKRALGSNLLTLAFREYCELYLGFEAESYEDIITKVKPNTCASIIASFFASRKAIKTIDEPLRQKFGKVVSVTSAISEILGYYIPELGLFFGTLYGSLVPSSMAVLYLKSPDQFGGYFQRIQKEKCLSLPEVETALFGVTSAAITAELVHKLGFGRRLSEAFLLGLLSHDSGSKESERIANFHFWVQLFLKDDPAKYITKENFLLDDEAIDAMLEKIKKIKENPENPWFLAEMKNQPFKFSSEEALDEMLNLD
ncbi:MAG: hypothetical protein N2654_02460 [Deltaproteobacteria bacterium]|nr:hypothetical protein [Deltaproteobacteria bacterium]